MTPLQHNFPELPLANLTKSPLYPKADAQPILRSALKTNGSHQSGESLKINFFDVFAGFRGRCSAVFQRDG